MSRLIRILFLTGAAGCALSACSSTGSMKSSSLALDDGHYKPRYMPASDVIRASEKSGRFGGAAYICGDHDCKTAVRAD